MSKIPKNYSHVFNVFKDRPLNKRQKIFSAIGGIAFGIYFIAQIAYRVLVEARYTGVNMPQIYNQFIIIPATCGFFIGFLMISLVAIEYVGRSFGKSTFWTSFVLVLGKVFKYILLPSIIIALLLLPVIISSYNK